MEGYEKVLLEDKEIWLLRRIDELKHEVDCAEAETEKAKQEAQSQRGIIARYSEFVWWVQENHPDIITIYQVINRLEGTDDYGVDSTK